MALKIDSLEVEIKTQADSASASIGNLNKELSKIARKSSQLKDLAKAMEDVKDSASGLGGGTGGRTGGGGRKKGESFFGSFTKKSGSFFKSIGRIALYRGIRTALKAVTSAIKEGTGNLYQYSKLMGGTFAANLDKVSTSVQYLKNGLAVGLAPVIESLTPAIVSISDALANAGNRISEMYAWQNNKDTFTKATKTAQEYAKALNEVKNAALGFDELNVINDDQSVLNMFGTGDVDPQRARETKNWLDGILAGTIGLFATAKLGSAFPSLLGFTKGEGGQLEYNLGDVLLKAAGLALTVTGATTVASSVMDSIKKGLMDDDDFKKMNLGIVETGGGLSLMTKSPLPVTIALAVSAGTVNNRLGNEDLKANQGYTDEELQWAYKQGAMSKTEFDTNGHWILSGLATGKWSWEDYIADYVEKYRTLKAAKDQERNTVLNDSRAQNPLVRSATRFENYMGAPMYRETTMPDTATLGSLYTNGSITYKEFNTGKSSNNDVSESGMSIIGDLIAAMVGEFTQAQSNAPTPEVKVYIDGKQIVNTIRKNQTLVGAGVAQGIVAD